jgi:hypothetical protein
MDRRALNRALMARQLLLGRAALPAGEAIELLVGLQAQAPKPPYTGLWTRMEGFRPEELSQLIAEREAVRVPLLRATIHLVSARDCLALRPVLQPVFERGFPSTSFGRGLTGIDTGALLAAARPLLEERPRTVAELGPLLQQQFAGYDARSLAAAVSYLEPLVQVPPRGLWERSGPPAWTTVDAWLGRPVAAEAAPDALDNLVLRYLAAFGPAGVRDVQTWSGLTRLGDVVERLRPRLVTFRDERENELFDLPDAPRPDRDTPAPARFLPEFDNIVLSHADRSRIMSEPHRKHIASRNGMVPGTVLVDGFVHGTWSIERGRGAAVLRVTPLAPLSRRDQSELTDEGMRLLAFTASDAREHEVRFDPGGDG